MPDSRALIKRLSIDKFREVIPDMECMGCGALTERGGISIHHINLDQTDNRLSNLSLLCQRCHTAAHMNPDGGWRRSLHPGASILPRAKNNMKISWEERFDRRFSHLGGIDGFKNLYMDDSFSLADIGIKFGVVRERIRQFAVRLSLPPRGKGFVDREKKSHYGFPYPHKPLSDYLEQNNIKPKEFSVMIGKSYQWTNQLLNMIRPITASSAVEIISTTKGALTIEQLMNPAGDHKEAASA